jgi:hypothetical protein
VGVATVGRAEVWHALGEEPTPAGPMTAAACADGQRDPDGSRPPGQVRQMALRAARHGGRGRGTAWAGGGRGSHRELEPHPRIRNRDLQQAEPTGGWE